MALGDTHNCGFIVADQKSIGSTVAERQRKSPVIVHSEWAPARTNRAFSLKRNAISSRDVWRKEAVSVGDEHRLSWPKKSIGLTVAERQ